MYSFEDIKKALPHRYPFLLIDKVLELTKDSILAIKNVSGNEEYFNGHFPTFSVMPGVLQVEAMAQASGLILSLNKEFDAQNEMAFFAGLDEVKFKQMVKPGDRLEIMSKIIAHKKNVLKTQAECRVEQNIVSIATLTLVIKNM
jgi:3-hydroxyacyl-[acyl-carrier-protein] dehydratase